MAQDSFSIRGKEFAKVLAEIFGEYLWTGLGGNSGSGYPGNSVFLAANTPAASWGVRDPSGAGPSPRRAAGNAPERWGRNCPRTRAARIKPGNTRPGHGARSTGAITK